MFDRVFGIETEYGITCASTVPRRPSPLDADTAARELFEPIIQKHRTTNVFLPNGGRLYLDVGSHPEYATAECRTISDILAQDRAGDQLFCRLIVAVNDRLREREVPGVIHLLKNNLDSHNNSFGCHENYLLHRRRDFRSLADSLVTFFVTRQILVGAGHVDKDATSDDGSPGRFCFSQRADKMLDAVSAASTRSRPIINTRDEPLGDGDKYRRMHVIVGDTNIAQPTTALKVGMTLIILHLIDNGMRLTDLALQDPMRAIKRISYDFTGKTPLQLVDGRVMSALDIQKLIFERVTSHKSFTTKIDPLLPKIMDLWARGLQALDSGDWSLVDSELDWVIKYRLLHDVCQAKNVGLDSPEIARVNFAYHDIHDRLRTVLESTSRMTTLIDDDTIERATRTAPAYTRAVLRGGVLALGEQYRENITADWYHLRIDDSSVPTITLKDPFATENTEVKRLLSVIEERHRLRQAFSVDNTHVDKGGGEVII